jgi:hypothetical protein
MFAYMNPLRSDQQGDLAASTFTRGGFVAPVI